jgi:hypothetical protein
MPPDENCVLTFKFADDSELVRSIRRDGNAQTSGADHVRMSEWDYKRTVLRQDEVAAFISARKGDKYSALLPLLHLQALEIAAENLRQLARAIDQRPSVKEKQQLIFQAQSDRKAQFGDNVEAQIWTLMRALHKKYLLEEDTAQNEKSLCDALERDLDRRIYEFSSDQRRHYLSVQVRDQDVAGKIERVRRASVEFAEEAEPLIDERLEVLQPSASLADKLEGADEVTCPACGQSVSVDRFQAHVQAEQARLKTVIDRFNSRRVALSMLADAVKATKATLERAELASWREHERQAGVREALAAIESQDLERLRARCSEETLEAIENNIGAIVARIASETSWVKDRRGRARPHHADGPPPDGLRARVRHAGRIAEAGPPHRLFGNPANERTRQFLSAVLEAG